MGRLLGFLYGIVAYLVFFATFLYAIGFVAGIGVPKTIDGGSVVPLTEALVIDILLMSVFAIQHSVMARSQFKRWWTTIVSPAIERCAYDSAHCRVSRGVENGCVHVEIGAYELLENFM